jgi:hypothetical protein
VGIVARFVNPGPEPASRIYDEASQPPAGACHASVTDEPLTATVNPVGAPGAAAHKAGTITTVSFDDPLVPLGVRARTRTKYVPGGISVATREGVELPVSAVARSLRPLAEPTSTT